MSAKLIESLEKLTNESRMALFAHLAECVEHVRFFSYGSNMNKRKFKRDMEKAACELNLDLSEEDRKNLELDKSSEKRILEDFKRELSNDSKRHGLAFSICCSSGSKVEGICHNIHVSVLPAFLRKEGLLPSDGIPSYRIIRVRISDESQGVLTLIGLKPKTIRDLKQEKICKALTYVDESIEGAKCFDVEYSDMKRFKSLLERELEKKQNTVSRSR